MTLPALPRHDTSDLGFLRSPPYNAAVAVPADDTSIGLATGFYVGSTGDVAVTTAGGTTVTFKNVPDGTLIRCQIQSIQQTGTTATNILILY